METLVLRKKIDSSKRIILDFPELNEGDEVALFAVYHGSKKETPKKIFNISDWASKWETDLGEDIQSTGYVKQIK